MSKRGVSKQRAFLAAFVTTAQVLKAAKAAKIDRALHYRWLREDPDYPKAFEEASDEAAQLLEDEAVRRAYEGVRKPLVFQGEFTYQRSIDKKTGEYKQGKQLFTREYSDSLLVVLLKRFRPDKYRERGSVELTGAGGGPVEIVERLNAARDRMAKLKSGADVPKA